MSQGPQTLEELQETTFYKAGAQAKKERRSLVKSLACMRPGCWQYDAFIAGYDAVPMKKRVAALPPIALKPDPSPQPKEQR